MWLIGIGVIVVLLVIAWDMAKGLHNIFAALTAILLELRDLKARR